MRPLFQLKMMIVCAILKKKYTDTVTHNEEQHFYVYETLFVELNQLPDVFKHDWILKSDQDKKGSKRKIILGCYGCLGLEYVFDICSYSYAFDRMLYNDCTKQLIVEAISMRHYYPDGIESGFLYDQGPIIEPPNLCILIQISNNKQIILTFLDDFPDYHKGKSLILSKCDREPKD